MIYSPLRTLGMAVAVALTTLAPIVHGAQAAALTECRVPGIGNSVQCGVLQRPLDPSKPEGTKIAVHYVVVPAMARRKLPDPVFVLAGGPGQSAISIAPQTLALFARLHNRRDLVFVDQRGTGKSAPLACDDPQHEPLVEQSDPDRQFERLMDCKAALLKLPYIQQPADLGLFTTTLAMQDLDAVRRELGAARINLVGGSYGTRAALEYMRQFPTAVRSAVLDGVAPPDMVLPTSVSTDAQAVLDALLVACEREPACAKTYPKLRADWAALLASVPKEVTAPNPLTGTPEHFTLTRDMLLSAIRGPLYAPAVAAALPAAITAAAHGRVEGLVGMGALLSSRSGSELAMGMHFSVVCAEDMPLLDPQRGTRNPPGRDFGKSFADLYRRVCSSWPRGAVPALFYQVPASRTPALLLAGGLDPVTPPRHAARVAQALGTSAHLVVVPNAGHGVMGIGCVRDVIFRFIDSADDADAAPVDASCVKRIPRPGVFLPITLGAGDRP
ncbi:MAG TPA: alpha/beta hydrolase [Burkholderiaceae bacterium]|nr:alpha/beta hydrolase [Burkholderiaceae bacterium]